MEYILYTKVGARVIHTYGGYDEDGDKFWFDEPGSLSNGVEARLSNVHGKKVMEIHGDDKIWWPVSRIVRLGKTCEDIDPDYFLKDIEENIY